MSTSAQTAAPALSKHTERAQAVRAFIAQVRQLAPDAAQATAAQLARVATCLLYTSDAADE